MAEEEEVGRTVPAERANPLLITLFPSFKELLSHRGAEGPFFVHLKVFHQRAHLWEGEEGKEGCAKVEQNPAEKAS